MLKVGLTGGIATGKSTVSQQLKAAGFPVLDADQVARAVVEPGSPLLDKIQAAFGSEMVVDGHLDRKKLGQRVFADKAALDQLNAIMQPAISQQMRAEIEAYQEKGTPVLILDVPLLFERGYQESNLVDWVVVVAASPAIERQRLETRNGLSDQEADQRIKAQLPLSEKVAQADWVINNDGDLAALKQSVATLIQHLKEVSP
ncbi:dephospho-CoA kinase [Leuconostocaceae bacterium ESL0723]|nr:dephospho-CoA kinase [Leuconostocaceae bacterium ESL0723]